MTCETLRAVLLPSRRIGRPSLSDALRGFGLFCVPMAGLCGLLSDAAAAALLVLTVASAWTGHAAALRESVAHRRFWRGLLCAGFASNLIASFAPAPRDAAALAQAAFFAAAFVLLFQRAAWRRWLLKLAPAGRMALTNGLAQALSSFCLHGLSFEFDPAVLVACGIAIFTLQAAFSCWWLARYNAGPAEWACHRLAGGQTQPMRRRAPGAEGRSAAFREEA